MYPALSTYPREFIPFHAWENLTVKSAISPQWLLCDLPVANPNHAANGLFGTWNLFWSTRKSVVHSREALPRAGMERGESVKGTAHLGGEAVALPVPCQRFNAWQGALPGSQGLSWELEAARWCWNSVCPELREFVTATAFKMPSVTHIHLLPLLGLQFLAHAEADNKPVASVCSINHWTKSFGTGALKVKVLWNHCSHV